MEGRWPECHRQGMDRKAYAIGLGAIVTACTFAPVVIRQSSGVCISEDNRGLEENGADHERGTLPADCSEDGPACGGASGSTTGGEGSQ